MLTPDGQSANKIDKVMLLAFWARAQEKKASDLKLPMIFAGMGKPTYPLHADTRKFLAEYWKAHNGDAIDYGDPQGDLAARELMANAMSKWYSTEINARNVLFPVGGAGALHAVFAALKAHVKTSNFRVITPFPYYTLYADNNLHLHPIYVMNNKGYRLTAESLLSSIKSAEILAQKDGKHPRAVLICDPNNPLGSALGESELKKIAQVLREHPDLTIILDEAYAEMVLDGTKHVSLLSVAPDLKERMVVMRSATKGLSAAGERMAITLAFNPNFMSSILENSIRVYGHAPRSLQMAYATTMDKFTDADRISINNFYRLKVDYVSKRLIAMGAAMPDKNYRVQGTFYVLGDFSDSIGGPLSQDAAAALEHSGKINTDEDIAYTLLFNDSVMVAPASYYGVDKHKGFLRITCSAEDDKIEQLMNRLEEHLKQSRLRKQQHLKQDCTRQLALLGKLNASAVTQLPKFASMLTTNTATAFELKEENKRIENYLLMIKRLINRETPEGKQRAAIRIQSTFRGHRARVKTKEMIKSQHSEWLNFVERVSPQTDTGIGAYLKHLTVAERLELKSWKEHLKEKESPPPSANFFMSTMSYALLKPYIALLVFVGLASGIVGCLGVASAGVIGLAAASIVGVATTAVGLSFFSQSLNRAESEDIALKEYPDEMQFCALI